MKEKIKLLQDAHRHSIHNKEEIKRSNWCGCFHCLETFPAEDVDVWIDRDMAFGNKVGSTALCPKCGVDSVVADASGFSLHNEFLREMSDFYFATNSTFEETLDEMLCVFEGDY